MAAPAISIRNLDHLGLVAALCQELGIARMIDALLPKTPPFKVSHGEALVAMIVNGLGFHSSTLHMFPQFFQKHRSAPRYYQLPRRWRL